MSTTAENSSHSSAFWTPPAKWDTASGDVPVMPRSESNAKRSLYHVHYKVPPGDSPYGIAKRVQLVEKDPSKAVSLFWAAINSGDRVDSALKDMAVVMKQLNRSDEAIEAIKSFRHLCPVESQESLDNVLLELYKRSGKLKEQIQMLRVKLKRIEEDISLRGKKTKVGRSQGRKVIITIEKEYSRLLGNLAWTYLQQKDYISAEEHYRKALSLEPDKNKQCNLAICLMHLNKITEAKLLLQAVGNSCENGKVDDSFSRSFDRATQLLGKLESDHSLKPINQKEEMYGGIQNMFLSCARRNFRGPSRADGNKLLGYEIPKRSAEVHQQLPLIALNRAPSLLQNVHDGDISLSGSKRGNIEGTSSYARRLSDGHKEEDFLCMKEYDTSFSLAKSQRELFTQPQKCLRLANKCNQGSNSGCTRKLIFQQGKDSENVQLLPYNNVDQHKEPDSARDSTNEDMRRNTLGGPATMKSKSSMISISIGVLRTDFLDVDEQRKDTRSEFSVGSITPVCGFGKRKECPEFEDPGWNSAAYSMGLIEEAENGNQVQKSRQKLKKDVEYLQDFSASENRKSWADMAEEDEQEFINESKDSLAHEQGFPSGESVLSAENTPINYSVDNEAGEQFADDNRNRNTILESPCSLKGCENSSQKLQSLVLKDGYYTQPLHAGSSMYLMAKQLSYDQYGNLEKVQTSFVSPLQKRSLNFEKQFSISSGG